MQQTKKINYKGYILKGTLFTPFKKDSYWDVNVFDKYGVPVKHTVSFIDQYTKRETTDVFWKTFDSFDNAKNFVDSLS
jgi:hypothetical protein